MLNIILEKACLSALENIKCILFAPLNQGFSHKLRLMNIIAFTFLSSVVLISCSQEKHTFVSKNFHNTTAHYNAYFLAREKMKEVDAQIITSNVDDYNKILTVYPQISDGTLGSIKTPLEEVIKKASLIHEKHKNSVWLDDGYIIIGKSYYYRHEFPTAMAFFKFVNSNSKDNVARHEALVLLMRTYIDSADYFSAKLVSDYLNKKQADGDVLTDENAKDLFLARAFYHQKLEEFGQMIPNLEKAEPLLKKRDEKARVNFILGQLHQAQQNDSSDNLAYKHYKSTIKRNPPYELLFHSKLYLTQVSKFSNSNRKKVERYFKKLLKDKKNLEYKDKIYYEIARYELKQNNPDKAIGNLEKSLEANTKNIPQKGLSYLKLAEIYYDQESFDQSKLYYDSATSVWDKEDKRYKFIANRQKILAEFAGYKQTVQREDSLQKLSKMSKEQLDLHIDQVIAKEKEDSEKLALQNEAKKRAKANSEKAESLNLGGGTGSFPLTNAIAIASGRAEFPKIWGPRKLEDNWRRSQKENFDFANEKINDSGVDGSTTKDTSAVDSSGKQIVNKDGYYKDIPFTKDQLDTSNKKIEFALYNIGKIYNQKLNEPEKSIKTFDNLLSRFPNSEYEAEIYYFIYLIYKGKGDVAKTEVYRSKILTDFPTSLYAKLLKNPNYLQDNKLANQQAHLKYKEVFELYKSGSYKSADSLIKIIRIEFPDNDIEDKLSLISIMILGQTSNALVYKSKLESFIEDYSSSSLVPKAKELLSAANSFIGNQNNKGTEINIGDAKYSTELNRPHHLVVIFPINVSSKTALREFKNYNKLRPELGLTVDYLPFSDSTYSIVVKGFKEKFPAQVYLNKLKNEKSFFQENGYNRHPVFIITNHNYQLFYESKNLDGYLKFYKEKY